MKRENESINTDSIRTKKLAFPEMFSTIKYAVFEGIKFENTAYTGGDDDELEIVTYNRNFEIIGSRVE